MASASVMKLARMAESGRRALSNIRARAKAKETQAISMGEVVLGGVAAGAIDATMGEGGAPAELFGLPLNAALGGAGVLAAFSGVPGAIHAGYIGAGMAAYTLGNVVRDQMSEG